MQRLEVSGAVRHIYIYIYIIRQIKVNNYIISAEYQFCSRYLRNIIINMADTPTTMGKSYF